MRFLHSTSWRRGSPRRWRHRRLNPAEHVATIGAMKRILPAAWCGLLFVSLLPAAKTLDMWVVDSEGAKSLLIVSPSGQSMLIDTGFPGNNDRDTNRIVEACQAAGVKKLDIMVITHYDLDHVNNAPSVVSKIPVDLFIDHGPAAVTDRGTTAAVKAYDHNVVPRGSRRPRKMVAVAQLVADFVVLSVDHRRGGRRGQQRQIHGAARGHRS